LKRLILLRHAKAVSDKPGLDDRDRMLADRGRVDAVRMGQFLREEGLVPDAVLCSPAARTHETLDLVLPQLGCSPWVKYPEELYLARWLTIVNLVRQTAKVTGTLLIVGHNPGLEDCARKLARPPGDAQARKLHEALRIKFPTAALAALDFDIADWKHVDAGEGELEQFTSPKDLA
jgi:phosphohistidine phosphatase